MWLQFFLLLSYRWNREWAVQPSMKSGMVTERSNQIAERVSSNVSRRAAKTLQWPVSTDLVAITKVAVGLSRESRYWRPTESESFSKGNNLPNKRIISHLAYAGPFVSVPLSALNSNSNLDGIFPAWNFGHFLR